MHGATTKINFVKVYYGGATYKIKLTMQNSDNNRLNTKMIYATAETLFPTPSVQSINLKRHRHYQSAN